MSYNCSTGNYCAVSNVNPIHYNGSGTYPHIITNVYRIILIKI